MPSSSEVTKCSQDLYALLSSPFERDLDMVDYKAYLDLPVSPDNALFEEEANAGLFNMMTGRDLQRGKDWSVAIGYVAASQRLDFTALNIPLKSPRDDESAVFRRINNGYFVPFLKQNERETELISIFDYEGMVRAIPPRYVTDLLVEAGYIMPELFTTPDDLRLHMAELADRATNWRIEEAVTIPEDPEAQTTIRRVLSSFDNGARAEMDVQLTAIGELIDSENEERKQMVIDFTITDYERHGPEIFTQLLKKDLSDIAIPGNEAYIVVQRMEKKVTAQLLSQLIHGLLDTMTGIYD